MNNAPNMWSTGNPKLQVAWDATSLSALMKCPRYYENSIIKGYRGSSVDTEFGGYFASACEVFDKARLNGQTKKEAQLNAVRYAIEATWIKNELRSRDQSVYNEGNRIESSGTEHGPKNDRRQTPAGGSEYEPSMEASTGHDGCHHGHPWGGSYGEQWRCTGTEPFRNSKGNRAKCPYSHKGKWYPSPAPSSCGLCGSSTEIVRTWSGDDKYKDRLSLIRLLVWWTDEQPDILGTVGLSPLRFPDGTPAIELSFAFPLPFQTPSNEPYIAAGHFDKLVYVGSDTTDVFVKDQKTTKAAIGQTYWKQYSPNVQVDFYDLASSILYPSLNMRGVVIDAAQIMVEGARFATQSFYRSEVQREEFLNEIGWWLKQAERYADENYWPMNRAACFNCPFRDICSMDPGKRETYLKANYEVKHWNPLEQR